MNPFLAHIAQIAAAFVVSAGIFHYYLKFDIPLSLFLGCIAVVMYSAAYWVFLKHFLNI